MTLLLKVALNERELLPYKKSCRDSIPPDRFSSDKKCREKIRSKNQENAELISGYKRQHLMIQPCARTLQTLEAFTERHNSSLRQIMEQK
ncbi:unnamed protein product [Albugo candida]|uniref:Uncharacterized protein n=1 Tax=Albugo candida TaxID=65357 RepID=A0A024GVJ5_9STRA|nr:unnamed protein product [Albugo candida]|eukprot:CCI50658.1 unnamed protein product [Albugo candida]